MKRNHTGIEEKGSIQSLEFFKSKINELELLNRHLESQNDHLQQASDTTSRLVTLLESKYEKEVEEKEELQDKLERTREKKNKLKKEIRQKTREESDTIGNSLVQKRLLEKLKNKLAEKSQECDELAFENDNLITKNTKLNGRLDEMNSIIEELRNENDRIGDLHETSVKELSIITTRNVESSRELEESIVMEKEVLENRINTLSNENRKELAKIDRKYTKLDIENQTLREKLKNVKEKARRMLKDLDQRDLMISELIADKKKLEKLYNSNVDATKKEYENRIFFLEKKIEFYKTTQEDVDKEVENRYILLSKQKETLQKRVGKLQEREVKMLKQVNILVEENKKLKKQKLGERKEKTEKKDKLFNELETGISELRAMFLENKDILKKVTKISSQVRVIKFL